jgi:hypothetical protein
MEQGARVVLIHPFGRKLLAIIPKHVAPKAAANARHMQPSLIQRVAAIAEILDIGLYVWVAYIRCLVFALLGRRDVWLVSDRWFDDLLVKHRRAGTLPTPVLAMTRRLVPHIDTTIWLHTEPHVAMKRDQDFKRGYYEELHAVYTAAAERYGWRIIPTSGQSPQAVFERVSETLDVAVPSVHDVTSAEQAR